MQDELLGELVGLIQGRPIEPHKRPLRGEVLDFEGREATLLNGIDLNAFIRRCVRGFHAALYKEWLPEETKNAFHPPFYAADIDGNTGQPADAVQAMLANDKGLHQQALFTATIKKNRLSGNTDSVVTRNGKCIYECVWPCMDDGQRVCFFALGIYDWERAGDVFGFTNRGCVGFYQPKTGLPPTASRATDLDFPFPNDDKLNPFGS